TIPAWQKQAWLLYKADINQLAQRPREARILARRAVRQDFTDLQAGSLAGPFARWLALTSTPEAYKPTKLALRKLIVQLYRFDTLDQVEIICAMHFVTENHRSRARGLAPLAPLPSL